MLEINFTNANVSHLMLMLLTMLMLHNVIAKFKLLMTIGLFPYNDKAKSTRLKANIEHISCGNSLQILANLNFHKTLFLTGIKIDASKMSIPTEGCFHLYLEARTQQIAGLFNKYRDKATKKTQSSNAASLSLLIPLFHHSLTRQSFNSCKGLFTPTEPKLEDEHLRQCWVGPFQ